MLARLELEYKCLVFQQKKHDEMVIQSEQIGKPRSSSAAEGEREIWNVSYDDEAFLEDHRGKQETWDELGS